MPIEEENDIKEKQQTDAAPQPGFGLFTWALLGAVVIAGATGGFALSQLMGGDDPEMLAAKVNESKRDAIETMLAAQNDNVPWLYEKLEPVLANLDEPGVTRYVRVTVSLEISPELDKLKGEEFLDRRQMVLRDWMTTYFAGLSLEDVRGTRNLSRIKKEVVENFNKILFPDSRPFVVNVLFKEFAVQ